MPQIHKHFTSDQVKELLERYLSKEIERRYIQEIPIRKKYVPSNLYGPRTKSS